MNRITVAEYTVPSVYVTYEFTGTYEGYKCLVRWLEGTEYSSNVDWTEGVTVPLIVHIHDYNGKLAYTVEYMP